MTAPHAPDLWLAAAVAILALNDVDLAARLDAWREKQTAQVAERPENE